MVKIPTNVLIVILQILIGQMIMQQLESAFAKKDIMKLRMS